MRVRNYKTAEGDEPVRHWVETLKDRKAQQAIARRVTRLLDGNLGDHKVCGGGIWELRFFLGPGYRLYSAREDNQVLLLLAGGDKSTQAKDIERAASYLQDWKERADERS